MVAGLYICVVDEIHAGQLAPIVVEGGPTPFVDLHPERLTELSRPLADGLDDTPRVFLGNGPWGETDPDAAPLPTPLARIEQTLGIGPTAVDDAYIASIMVPFDRRDDTRYRLGRQGEIWRFLRQHEGKRALLTIRPDNVIPTAPETAEGEVPAEGDAVAAAEPDPPPLPEPPLERGFEATTVDGVRPLALVLVSSQSQSSGFTVRERILAALATIGTFGASVAAAAGLNNLIR